MKTTTLLAVAAKVEGLFNTPNIFIFMRPHIGRENWHVWLGKVRIHSQMIGLESLLYFNLHFIFVQRRGFKNDFIPSALHPTPVGWSAVGARTNEKSERSQNGSLDMGSTGVGWSADGMKSYKKPRLRIISQHCLEKGSLPLYYLV